MNRQNFQFHYDVYTSADELQPDDAELLIAARKAIEHAYAPYSGFRVGAAARLGNGQLLTGSNQENASYPAGICAERVLLSTVSSLYPGTYIQAIALSYMGNSAPSDHPISPCGICRQSLQEYQDRQQIPIRLLLGGMTGEVFLLSSATDLLPFSFSQAELGKP